MVAGLADPSNDLDLEGKLREALDGKRRAEEDLWDFTQNAVEGLHALGPDGAILWANQAELDLLGFLAEEYIGRPAAVFHVEPEVVPEILDRLSRGETVRDLHARLWCKDRSIKSVLINATGLWQNGELVRARCFIRDVTAQRQDAEARHRLAAIVESSEDAIVGKDLNGIVTSWNASAERIFGFSADEIVGLPIQTIIPAERLAEEETVLARIRRGESVRHFETIRRRKDGTLVPVSITVSPIRDESGTIIGASKIARDISERARHEGVRDELLARAEQARADAERANRVKDEFLATLSHELRSPLNAISGWSQLAAAQLNDVSNPIVRRALDVIASNVTLQLRLINDLLDVSSILNGKLALRTDTVDIAAVVGAVVDGVRPEAAAKGVHVQLRLNAGRPHVTGDAARLQQVVWNLLSNALKFTPPDGRITVTLGRSAAGLRITVQDTGEGIPAEFLPHVFDRFRQADSKTTRRHGGLGLGLAVVNHLVQAHGGRITAESPGQGHGATFTVELPAAQDADRQSEAWPELMPRALMGLRLLVVDDDADTRDLLCAMLRPYKVDVSAAGSMAEAISVLRNRRFDILLSDLAMPRHDGYELIETVRRDNHPSVSRIGAIAVTAHADGAYRAKAFASGFDDYVTKPVDSDRLVRVIEQVVQRHGGQRPTL